MGHQTVTKYTENNVTTTTIQDVDIPPPIVVWLWNYDHGIPLGQNSVDESTEEEGEKPLEDKDKSMEE